MCLAGEHVTPLSRDRKQTDNPKRLVDSSTASSMHSAAKTLANPRPHMSAPPTKRVPLASIRPYLVALLSVAAAAAVSYPLRTHIYITPLFFAAVVVSCWYSGTRAGVFATIQA